MSPARVNEAIAKLVVRLHDSDEHWSFSRIANHVKMTKCGVIRIYQREKKPKIQQKRGPKRNTSERYFIAYVFPKNTLVFSTDRRIARKSKEDPNLTAPEIREELALFDVTNRTVQRR